MKMLHFPFGEISVFDNFIIAVMKEGTTVIPEYNSHLIQIAETHFKGKYFGYISYRKNSYAVDPLIYIELSKIPNLVAFAIVATEDVQILNIEIEKIFLSVPLKHLTCLDEAKSWVDATILEVQNGPAKNDITLL